ncbi:hypothetical protein HYZ99_00915 [Candidatus Peregrinibacteria bacterium]|nr:hypothetical protein [Candidatus Peregrinibacteria bacterium]
MPSPRFSIALAGILLSLLAIPTVSAYVTPEEMLTGTANHTSAVDPQDEMFEDEDWTVEDELHDEDLPSGIRYTSKGTPYRVQESDNQHTMLKKYASSSSEHTAAPVIEEDPEEMEPEEGDITTIELDGRTIRLLERLTRRENAKIFSSAAHAGAPLAPTGSATVIAMLAMLAAIGWTIRRARKSEAVK